jgi:hypothetical protein
MALPFLGRFKHNLALMPRIMTCTSPLPPSLAAYINPSLPIVDSREAVGYPNPLICSCDHPQAKRNVCVRGCATSWHYQHSIFHEVEQLILTDYCHQNIQWPYCGLFLVDSFQIRAPWKEDHIVIRDRLMERSLHVNNPKA